MVITKREYSTVDVPPRALYVKKDGDSTELYPLLEGMLNPGFSIPEYDEITLTYTGSDISVVVYKYNSVSVATITLSYTDGNLTGVVKT
jgi:hypothetical protein